MLAAIMNLAAGIHNALTDDDDGRVCQDITNAACTEAPRSFGLILLSYVFSKLGDAITSPKTTLAWLSSALGTPAFVIGFLVPIRESGSMIPQLFIGGSIRRLPRRKWVWVAGAVGQAACVVGLGAVALFLRGASAGWTMLGLVALFSLARSLCSIAAKDVLGKTIPKNRRGQLTGWASSASGLIAVGVGAALMLPVASSLGPRGLGALLLGAAALWVVAAALYARVPEPVGDTDGGRNALEALSRLRILVTDRPFRRFVIARALLMCSALSAPYYVALAQENSQSPVRLLGAFVVAAGVASLIAAPLWGRMADRSSKRVMATAAFLTSGIGIATAAAAWSAPAWLSNAWFVPAAYFVLSVAHSGVRVGRKTYVVNLADGNQRTDYVAISNTVIGVLLLVVGAVGSLVPLIGVAGVIATLAAMGCLGATLCLRLNETDDD